MFKKCISVVLSAVLMCSVLLTVVGAAAEVNGNVNDYPVVMVAGYSSSELALVDEDGNKTRIWGIDMDDVIDRVFDRIYDLGKGLVLTAKGNADYLGRVVGEEFSDYLEYMKVNDDGTSKYNVQVENTAIEETNVAYIHENGLPEEYINDSKIINEILKYVDEEDVFCYTNDWRMSVYDCACGLDKYIEKVKEYTGKDKVNIIAISHGGQVSAVYLSLFGYKQNVNNAVLTVPAIGGAGMAYDVLSGEVVLDEYTTVKFLQHGNDLEGKYDWLVQAQQLGFLDEVIDAMLPYVYEVLGNWLSMWDFIPLEYYDELKAERLDPVKNAAIIEKSDMVHYEIMANYHENLQKCINDYGINITIIAGTDVPCVTGMSTNGDALIRTVDSTGAACAEWGKRYSDGFTGAHTMCDDPTHDHVSPSFEVDASTAFLPENTWFIEDLYHGMTFHDEFAKNLALRNLLFNDVIDVHSDPDYPQFHASTNRNNAVFMSFEKSGENYASSQDKYIVVKNISQTYPVKITSISFEGCGLVAQTWGIKAIKPGEEIKIEITGKLPQISNGFIQAKVNYEMQDNTTALIGERVFDFKVMNGEPVSYDVDNPFTDADYVIGFESAVSGDTNDILVNTGIASLVSFIYDWFLAIMEQLGISRFF